MDVIGTWHRVIAQNDAGLLDELIADNAVFHSPVVHTPQNGKAITIRYLTAANTVLNNGRFAYVGQWSAPNSAVLEFTTEIEGIVVDGADFIRWNEAGKIVDFKVMIRPLKAIDIVMRKMAEQLSSV